MSNANETAPANDDVELCQDCGAEVTSERESRHVQGLCDGCERARIDLYPELLELVDAIDSYLWTPPWEHEPDARQKLADRAGHLLEIADRKLRREWCECDPSPDQPIFRPDRSCPCGVEKHHYHCRACKGVSQIG